MWSLGCLNLKPSSHWFNLIVYKGDERTRVFVYRKWKFFLKPWPQKWEQALRTFEDLSDNCRFQGLVRVGKPVLMVKLLKEINTEYS